MMEPRLRAGVDMMLRVGGSFERALAQCAIEANDGHEFMRCLVAAHKVASDANASHIYLMFGYGVNLWRTLDWSAKDRLDAIVEAFPAIFERHIAMAEAAA